MSLTQKRKMTEAKLDANRANIRRSHHAVSPAGQARAPAANLWHGYGPKSADMALSARGGDPKRC